MRAWLNHDFAEKALLHALPVDFFLEAVDVELKGVVEGFLGGVVTLPIQLGQFVGHAWVDPASKRLSCGMLHHGHHALPSQFRRDAADVCLAFLKVLKPHVDGPFSHHVLYFQIEG